MGASLELGCWCLEFFKTSVNAKQLEQPVFQAGPNRCESDHGHFKCGVGSVECGMKMRKLAVAANPSLRNPHSEFRIRNPLKV